MSQPWKGALAPYWMAATLTDARFRMMYKRPIIERIDVYSDCSKIQAQIEIGTENGCRLGLYTTTQLVFGAMKIVCFQACFLFDDSIKLVKMVVQALDVKATKQRKNRNADRILERQELPDPNFEPQNIAAQFDARIDLYQLDEVTTPPNISVDPDARLNFGMLTDDTLTEFVGIDEALVRAFGDIEEVRLDAPDVPVEISGDWNLNISENQTLQFGDQTTTVEPIQEETTLAPPIEEQIPEAATRDIETTILPDTVALPEISELESHAQINLSPEPELVLPAVPEERAPRAAKPRRILDDQKMLSSNTIKTQVANVRIHTATLIIPPAAVAAGKAFYDRLRRHTCFGPGGTWGQRLMDHYQELSRQLKMRRPETPNAPEEDVTDSEVVQEAVRAKSPELAAELTTELSTAIPPAQQDNLGMSKDAENTIICEIAPQDIREETYNEASEYAPQLPDISEMPTLQNDGVIISEESNTEIHQYTASPALDELLENIMPCWQKEQTISFHDMLRKQNYDRTFAVKSFIGLLVLHRQKRVTLRQTRPFEKIWILQ